MESTEAEALRKAWGDKPCEHPWWVKKTVRGTDTDKDVCKTCGQDRSKGKAWEGTTTTKSDKAAPLDQKVEDLDVKVTIVNQKATYLDSKAAPLNQKVKDLDSAVDSITAMLTADFAFTMLDEARIASAMGKLRDAFGRWRERLRKRKRSI